MAGKQAKTEVVEVKGNALPAGMNAEMMAADSGLGRENMDMSDMSLPYILLLQDLSPQVDKKSGSKVDGAESGDLFNNVTQEIWGGEDGMTVIPCAFQKAWVEWQPDRGGFVKSHPTDALMDTCSRNDQGYDVLPSGNILVPTYYYYAMILDTDGGYQFAVISMARTAMKKGRKWNSVLSSMQVMGPNGMFNPPMFAQQFKITSEVETKGKNSFYNWHMTSAGLVSDPAIYQAAKAFAKSVCDGAIKATVPVAESTEEAAEVL